MTQLDGDIVLHNLPSALNFSKDHRDINVRRIGYAASEITKGRGTAICAPIAPYAKRVTKSAQPLNPAAGFSTYTWARL